jgi:hypothetical protein
MKPAPKFFFFPAAAIGVLLAIFFFKIYGPMTRPEVPTPVSMAVSHFTPGVVIGNSVASSSKLLSKLTYTKHVGFVGTPLDRSDIQQVRLLLSPRDRSSGGGDPQARVDAVEMLATRGYMRSEVMVQFGNLFRAMPRFGCISPSREGMPYREVQYWTTKNDRGGIAILSDWITKPAETGPDTTYAAAMRAEQMRSEGFTVEVPKITYKGPPPVVWSMLFWTGPFRGQYTLRADFEPRPCNVVAPK